MPTSSSPFGKPRTENARATMLRFRAHRSRVIMILGLLLLVEVAIAYLISWISPPPQTVLMPISISDYQARALAMQVRASEPAVVRTSMPSMQLQRVGTTRQGMLQALDSLARHSSHQPVIVYVSTLTLQAGEGEVYLLPEDATPGDDWTWLRLRDVLLKLKACPAKQKLLVLDILPSVTAAWSGNVHADVAAALPRELKAVPDEDRCVLCSCSARQTAHVDPECRQSLFASYFLRGVTGQADGWNGVRDGFLTINELAGYVQAHVERASLHQHGERQTPMLFGERGDEPLLAVESTAATRADLLSKPRKYPAWLLDGWKVRDNLYESGLHQRTPRYFQQQQALLHATEQAWRAGADESRLRKGWFRECLLLQDAMRRVGKQFRKNHLSFEVVAETAYQSFAQEWNHLQQQLVSVKPSETEFLKNRLLDALRRKHSLSELDTVVFMHARAQGRLDPKTIRLYDQLLHPTEQTVPRTGATLRLRQLADLAMRVEVFAWPHELIQTLLDTTETAENALEVTPTLPHFQALMREPLHHRQAGEIRLWTRGFSSLDDARRQLMTAKEQLERLLTLNEQWHGDQQLLAEALAELPVYAVPLEDWAQFRESWTRTAVSARLLANVLQGPAELLDRSLHWNTQFEALARRRAQAAVHADALRKDLQKLRVPFGSAEVSRMEQQCRAADADAHSLRHVEAMLRMSGPRLRAEDRLQLWQSAQGLGRRLHEETLAQDCQGEGANSLPNENEELAAGEEGTRKAVWRVQAQLTLAELAGAPEEQLRPVRQGLERCRQEPSPTGAWGELGLLLRRLVCEQMPQRYRQEKSWPERERLVGLLAPLDRYAGIDDVDPTPGVQPGKDAQQQQERWQHEHRRHQAHVYQQLNLDCPGIEAARHFYATPLPVSAIPTDLELKILGPVEPLTHAQPYTHCWLEVTRRVPAGAFGSVDLQVHRAEETWLEVSPESATLPGLQESREPRTLVQKVPLRITRRLNAERSGLPAPSGFLVEARFEARSYYHLIVTPLPPDRQEVQILVSADPKTPESTENEIRVRPGKMKQTHHVYVKNLTNRPRMIHVDVNVNETSLHHSHVPIGLEPDGVHRLNFEGPASTTVTECRGGLQVQVLDQQRQKILATQVFPVSILPPQDYVKVANVFYEPGGERNNKWRAQLQSTQRVAGPSIAAELVLPMRRIPGLVGIGGGTLQVELPTLLQSPRTLFAEKIRLANDVEQEGPVYLNIDGVPRAFVYRTTFTRNGETLRPARDERPAVRLVAPMNIMAGVNYLVDVEVDNPPPGAKLEVTLGRIIEGESFKPEIVREYSHSKQHRIRMEVSRGGLSFEASIQDWTASFDTRAITGPRELRARLLADDGKEYAWTSQPVMIDSTPPQSRILPLPAQVQRGTTLALQAQGLDPESGIAQVVFFVGRPNQGEIPPGALKIKAAPINLDFTLWTAPLLVPMDHQGPLTVSVYVVNRAGMASVDTAVTEVIDHEPGRTGLGQVHGRVMEGLRPQPDLMVTLTDEQGKEIARTRTQPDGSFLFHQLSPGRYRVLCVKPESQRRAVQGVTVDADRTSRTELSLSL